MSWTSMSNDPPRHAFPPHTTQNMSTGRPSHLTHPPRLLRPNPPSTAVEPRPQQIYSESALMSQLMSEQRRMSSDISRLGADISGDHQYLVHIPSMCDHVQYHSHQLSELQKAVDVIRQEVKDSSTPRGGPDEVALLRDELAGVRDELALLRKELGNDERRARSRSRRHEHSQQQIHDRIVQTQKMMERFHNDSRRWSVDMEDMLVVPSDVASPDAAERMALSLGGRVDDERRDKFASTADDMVELVGSEQARSGPGCIGQPLHR